MEFVKIPNVTGFTSRDWKIKKDRQDEYIRIRISLQAHGQLRPIHVYGVEDLNFILEGRLVYRAMRELGFASMYAIQHGNISSEEAKLRYIQLAFTDTSVAEEELAERVHELSKVFTLEQLQNRLPFDRAKIQHYIDLYEFHWKEWLKEAPSAQIGLFA